MRGVLIKALVILSVSLIAGGLWLAGPALADGTLKLGWVADMSGIGATFYKSQKAAIDLFVEETNAAGGIMGKKLEVVARDAALKPDVGANLARELILSEKCDFLIGPTSSAVALAVSKVSNEFKKIVYFHTSNTEALTTTDYQPYMYQVVPNTGIEGRGLAVYLAKKPYTKYGYIGYDYAYGHTQFDAFKDQLKKLNPKAEIVVDVWPKLGETNYSSFIPTLMAKSPEVIFSSLWGGGLASFVKQAAPYGLFKKSTLSALYDLDMLRATGQEMPEGLLGYARCPFYGVNTPAMTAFTQKYMAKYKEEPADWALMGYDGLLALKKAIETAGSLDSEKVVKVLGGLKWNSLRGDKYVRAEDHMANVGIYVGTTAKDPKYKGFLILKNVEEVPAEKAWLPVEEVKKLQPK
ncbi:MAG: ABC transporter substrate-binding protein [Thermodesulfobacteriota bacterium]